MFCRAVVFDLDGVLIDSLPNHKRHWLSWAARHGLDGAATFMIDQGIRTVERIRRIAPHLDAYAEARLLEEAEIEDVGDVTAFPGTRDLLAALPRDRWAIVTSGARSLACARLVATELPIPPILITGEDVARGKPHPEGYLRAILGLSVVPSDAIVVEDTPAGIRAGKAAGARVLAVASTHDAHELKGAEAVLGRVSDLGAKVTTTGLELSMQQTMRSK